MGTKRKSPAQPLEKRKLNFERMLGFVRDGIFPQQAETPALIRQPARYRFARHPEASARRDPKVWPATRHGENGAGRASKFAAEFPSRDKLCLPLLPEYM